MESVACALALWERGKLPCMEVSTLLFLVALRMKLDFDHWVILVLRPADCASHPFASASSRLKGWW